MTPRISRSAPLQTLTIPTIVIHYAEPTPGLTPRTPYSQDLDEMSGQFVDDIHIKVHLSPSAPITPIQSRMPREKLAGPPPSRPQRKTQPNRGRRVIMWSVTLALLVIASLLLHHVNSNPQRPVPSNPHGGKPMEWITVAPQKAPATFAARPTPTLAVLDSIEPGKSSETVQH
ncbi:hypothetical protein RSOLAG1IB_07027 [Rhizoctonia solani AG-1 IB]|uniref:Uncharacterized protein n=1 Tax=Thanatephorus cucumeris (strain AG1-IB / isolate 7/3/14) TaxID=1108050 RepID=A0A0B7FDS6_THACB|nr:hypothetical protein RSOLAG1IB_07027 [Rhizoctonia solani AG-1 IB]